MKNYRPVSRRRVNPKRLALMIVIVVIIIAVIIFCAYMFSEVKLDSQKEAELLASGTYEEGVSVGGIDVSGMTYDEAKQSVEPIANQMMHANKIEFTVKQTPYSYSLEQLGVSVDIEPPLKSAMLYGREGTRWDLMVGKKETASFPIEQTFDETKVTAQINQIAADPLWNVEAINASYKVQTTSDEAALTTGGELIKTEPQDGYQVKTDDLIAAIVNQIKTQQYAPFDAAVEVIPSKESMQSGEPKLRGEFTTSFETSSADRIYNIWKMSDKLNGAVFYSGDVFSVNDTAGDRNEENGWKQANGIENGVFTPQYGGGICQVSTTMYNAALRAEMEIVNRLPHTIAAKYVDKGMDATISTGGPDFKVSNPLDDPMYMIIKCNSEDRKVTVQIWGSDDRTYDLKFWSEKIEDLPIPAVEYKTNATLGTFELKQLRPGQAGEKWEVYLKKTDKATGDVIEEKTAVTTSTYKPISPQFELGPGVPLPAAGTPIEAVKAQVAQLSGAVAPVIPVAPDATPAPPAPSATPAPPAPTDVPAA
ncbi:MAG: VanW family protein [Christensenellaceae bacterium]